MRPPDNRLARRRLIPEVIQFQEADGSASCGQGQQRCLAKAGAARSARSAVGSADGPCLDSAAAVVTRTRCPVTCHTALHVQVKTRAGRTVPQGIRAVRVRADWALVGCP